MNLYQPSSITVNTKIFVKQIQDILRIEYKPDEYIPIDER
jgi:hypothetical protein